MIQVLNDIQHNKDTAMFDIIHVYFHGREQKTKAFTYIFDGIFFSGFEFLPAFALLLDSWAFSLAFAFVDGHSGHHAVGVYSLYRLRTNHRLLSTHNRR